MLIWHDPYNETDTLVILLAELSGDSTVLDTTDALADALDEEDASNPVLCLYTRADIAVAERMEQGDTATDAVETWADQAAFLLGKQRRHRRRVTLVDADLVRNAPVEFLDWLKLEDSESFAPDPAPEGDPVLLMIAELALQANPAAQSLAEELQAASVTFSETGLAAPALPEAALDRYVAEKATLQTALRARESEIAKLRESQSLLTGQNRTQNMELSRLGKELSQMETRLAQLNQGLDSYQVQVSTLQEKLRLSTDRLADKNQLLDTLAEQLKQRQDEIDRIMQSRSMRLTAPIRRLGRLFRRPGP
ncbi:hypothetical protein RXV86_21785 [Alisedimentitalea sp. MJ-SS2]|uniref:hypothetical protein n=1 Tax=Aliisedimentitalea sp. MJ-SS2 TaxID=3049795 RepID=UPI002909B3CB|nr:hypothetical protein [Alisedimentitalea sp. MJ-SS2]MDU8930026.1 hypothetical protein [Alisedimentitalea sp. MJ-SS2]